MVKNDKKENTDKKVKLIPLGGLEQIGMNMTAIEYEDSIIVMDCGLAFPSDDMLGIDLVIPDVTYLTDNIDKVKGFVITHGHEDHIGALPYVLKMVNAPVYGTKLTIGLIDHKLKENNILVSMMSETDKKMWNLYTESDKQKLLQDMQTRRAEIKSTLIHELTHSAYTIKDEYGMGEKHKGVKHVSICHRSCLMGFHCTSALAL